MENNPGTDDEWGPATRVTSGSPSVSSDAPERRVPPKQTRTPAQSLADISARASGDAQSAYRKGVATVAEPAVSRHGGRAAARTDGPSDARTALDEIQEAASPPGRGLPAWQALVVLVVIAAIGGVFDIVSDNAGRVGFNYGIVIAAVVAMLLVRRSGMFPVIIAPPIVYTGASVVMLYARSGGLSNHKVLYDAAANWLVYGFPAIAAATAGVLIIAGIRLLLHR